MIVCIKPFKNRTLARFLLKSILDSQSLERLIFKDFQKKTINTFFRN